MKVWVMNDEGNIQIVSQSVVREPFAAEVRASLEGSAVEVDLPDDLLARIDVAGREHTNAMVAVLRAMTQEQHEAWARKLTRRWPLAAFGSEDRDL